MIQFLIKCGARITSEVLEKADDNAAGPLPKKGDKAYRRDEEKFLTSYSIWHETQRVTAAKEWEKTVNVELLQDLDEEIGSSPQWKAKVSKRLEVVVHQLRLAACSQDSQPREKIVIVDFPQD